MKHIVIIETKCGLFEVRESDTKRLLSVWRMFDDAWKFAKVWMDNDTSR